MNPFIVYYHGISSMLIHPAAISPHPQTLLQIILHTVKD